MNTVEEIKSYEKTLKETVSAKRYIHSVNVAESAKELAKIYGEDAEKAYIAGLLHDITKEYDLAKHLALMEKYGVCPEDVRVFDVCVFHGFTGSIYVKEILGINDKEILNAIKHHIVGRARMTTLEKIVFVSDCISKERSYEGVEELREVAKKDLDRAMIQKLINNVIKFSFKKGRMINPNAFEAYNDIVSNL